MRASSTSTTAAPLLIVNAAAIDPINNQADYDELLAAIRRMKRGRLYYNPLRSAVAIPSAPCGWLG